MRVIESDHAAVAIERLWNRDIPTPSWRLANPGGENVDYKELICPGGMITIFTSAFAQAARSRAPGQASVSNFAPIWWRGPEYGPLVPNWKYPSVPQNHYEHIYAAQTALPNATTVLEDLTRLVGGDVVTLLCHCQREDFAIGGMRCHLSCVASWLRHQPGIAVRTWDVVPGRP
jgi:hypothetical protein